ncbi:MAG: Crp/Fnr family transcriptional regulator [Xenococcaceae cyanobacterium MO_207.B15]|nr:Crp/Fnr family transcriptional regulator [Xenococcaceae cyanobacterium MO_207.B15]
MTENPELKIINQILAALPQSEYQRLVPHLELVSLPGGRVLQEPGEPIKEVYFPNQAMISLVSIMSDGSTTEVGLVGNEGMAGLPAILGGNCTTSRSIVQIPGSAMKLSATVLQREFHRGSKLQEILLLYTQALLTQVSQTAACNRQHNIKERLARWLLLVQDSVLSNELPLTQEFIANMLGTRRSGVTVAAGKLQKAGIIRYHRGKITIINQENLEAAACECYSLVHKEFIRLLGSKGG